MSYQILRPLGRVVRQTIRLLTPQEWEDKVHQEMRKEFDSLVRSELGGPMTKGDLKSANPSREILAVTPTYEAYADDEETQERQADVDDFDPETYNAYVQAQIRLPRGDDMSLGTVLRRKRNHKGNPIG